MGRCSAQLKVVVEPRRRGAPSGLRERDRECIAITLRIGDRLQGVEKSKCPEHGGIGAARCAWGSPLDLLKCRDRDGGSPSEFGLDQSTANPGGSDSLTQPSNRVVAHGPAFVWGAGHLG